MKGCSCLWLCGWVMGAAAPMAPPKEANKDKKNSPEFNQTRRKKGNEENEVKKAGSGMKLMKLIE